MSESQRMVASPLEQTDLESVLALVRDQAARSHTLDQRFREPQSLNELARAIEEECNGVSKGVVKSGEPLVVRNQEGVVRGYACPVVAEYPPDSEMLGLYEARNGMARTLTLPNSTEPDAEEVLGALLMALDESWRASDTLSETLAWPSYDPWPEPLLLSVGFSLSHRLGFRPPTEIQAKPPMPGSNLPVAREPGFTTRLARPADQEALVALHLAEISFHLPYDPFMRMVPAWETGFREKLARLWNGERVEEGAPLLVVVERDGEVVAMSENYLGTVPSYPERSYMSYLSPGRYGYFNSVSVREDMRGRGVGRLLVEASLAAFSELDVQAYYLFFSVYNPISRLFWLHMGFEPLLTYYQRRVMK